MDQSVPALVEAWTATLGSTLQLCCQLDDHEWDLPTGCPGWTVKDQLSHLIGVELEMLGEPLCAHEPAEWGPWVTDELGRHFERAVDLRRRRHPAEVLEELREVVERREAALAKDPPGPGDLMIGPLGRRATAGRVLRIRVFDCWAHEQDIRRATGRSGNLTGLAAEIARDRVVAALPTILIDDAEGMPGESLRLEVTGALPFTAVVAVDPQGVAVLVDPDDLPDPDASITMDWVDLIRRACGREGEDMAAITVTGDEELADAVLAHLAITP